MYQLWIFNTTFRDFQKVGPLITHAQGLTWILTICQHFDGRELRLLPAAAVPPPAIPSRHFVISARSDWPGE